MIKTFVKLIGAGALLATSAYSMQAYAVPITLNVDTHYAGGSLVHYERCQKNADGGTQRHGACDWGNPAKKWTYHTLQIDPGQKLHADLNYDTGLLTITDSPQTLTVTRQREHGVDTGVLTVHDFKFDLNDYSDGFKGGKLAFTLDTKHFHGAKGVFNFGPCNSCGNVFNSSSFFEEHSIFELAAWGGWTGPQPEHIRNTGLDLVGKVPVPPTLLLMLGGLAVMGFARRKSAK